jgi:hypothetical protein
MIKRKLTVLISEELFFTEVGMEANLPWGYA